MLEHAFKCAFCNEQSAYTRRAAAPEKESTNPYAKATRKYRCEQCSRINDVVLPGYDWALVDRELKLASSD